MHCHITLDAHLAFLIGAVIIQLGIVTYCAYAWLQAKLAVARHT